MRDLSRCLDCLPRGHDARHEPDPLGLMSVDDPAGQRQLLGARHSDGTRQSLRPAGAGRDAQPHLGQAEPGVLRRDADVAREGYLQAPAERVGLDRGDRRHG